MIYMPHVSLRVSQQEKEWMDSYANLHGVSLSDAIKSAFFEKLEDEYDLRTIREYENNKASVEFYSLEETKNELKLDDEL